MRGASGRGGVGRLLPLVSPGLFAALGGWPKTAALLDWPCTAEKVRAPAKGSLGPLEAGPRFFHAVSKKCCIEIMKLFSVCAVKTRSSPRLLLLAPTLQRFI